MTAPQNVSVRKFKPGVRERLEEAHADATGKLPRRYTQKKLASKLAVSVDTIANWERRVTAPRLSQARHYAKITGLPLDELLEAAAEVEQATRVDARLAALEAHITRIDTRLAALEATTAALARDAAAIRKEWAGTRSEREARAAELARQVGRFHEQLAFYTERMSRQDIIIDELRRAAAQGMGNN